MAEYSYSGNTYTDKSSGDTIDESHVNDLQDEVEIVEGVLTGGTDGQVLTADATGKAGWKDASGGGAFLFDSATAATVWDDSEGTNLSTITLTLDGTPITSTTWFIVWMEDDDKLLIVTNEADSGYEPFWAGIFYGGNSSEQRGAIVIYDPDDKPVIQTGGVGEPDVYLRLLTHAGTVVRLGPFVSQGPPAP